LTAAAGPLLLDSPAAMPCLHPKARHQHGTVLAYKLDRCRCLPCREAKNAYDRGRTRGIAYGTWNKWADAEPARAHVLLLMETRGIGWPVVAQRAGLTRQTVQRLLYGLPQRNLPPARRVRRATLDKLLAIPARRHAAQAPDLFTKEGIE
jgi:hypothetical protein